MLYLNFYRVPTLKNVIKAVYEPRKALILTFILLVILEYTFSLIAFRFFRDSYVPDDDNGLPQPCKRITMKINLFKLNGNFDFYI